MKDTKVNITLNVPNDIAFLLQLDEEQGELERNAMLLYPYIKKGNISYGKAAEILGMPKWEIITFYNDLGFPYIDYDISEIKDEISNYRKLQNNDCNI